MVLPTWNDSYATGDEAIDRQHRELLELVDDLERAEVASASLEAVYKALDLVTDFTQSHFRMEEELMVRVDYPQHDQDEMIQQHHEFTHYARLRVVEFRSGGPQSVLPLRAFLTEWLTVHEFGLDRKLAVFIRVTHRTSKAAEPPAL
jgi:hemerythrin-like metal-binding protein